MSKRNSSKTFYKSEDLKNLSDEEFFGDFWEDIFNMKITSRKDREERMKIEDNLKSHHKVNGFKAENSENSLDMKSVYIKSSILSEVTIEASKSLSSWRRHFCLS